MILSIFVPKSIFMCVYGFTWDYMYVYVTVWEKINRLQAGEGETPDKGECTSISSAC